MSPSRLGYVASAFCLLALVWLHSQFALHPQLGDWGGDNATYLIMAEHLRAPNAMTGYGVARSIFPWGFPALIAAFGGGVNDWQTGHLAVLGSLSAALLLAWVWWQQHSGRLVAGVLVAAFGLLPGGLLLSSDILSENTYIALSLLVCLLADQARSRPWLWFAALLAAVAALSTRSIGIALVPGLVWGLLPALRQQQKLARPALVAVLLVGLGWYLSNRGAGRYSHVGILNSGVDNLGGLLNLVLEQIAALWRGWRDLLQPFGGHVLPPLLLLVCAAVGCAVRLWRCCSDGPYVLGYLAIIVLWPFPAEAARFLYALFPVLLWQAWYGASWLAEQLGRWPVLTPRRQLGLALALPALLLASFAPTSLALLEHSRRPFPAELLAYRGMAPVLRIADDKAAQTVAAEKAFAAAALRRVGQLVPEGGCIQAVKPSLVALYSGRSARSPLPPWAPQTEFLASLPDCPYLLLLAYRQPMFPRMYPAFRLQGQNSRLIANLDDGRGQQARFGVLLKVE